MQVQNTEFMNGQTAVVIGASGLIGSFVVEALLKEERFSKVRVLVRRSLSIHHSKMEECITDFSDFNDYQTKLGTGHCIFCCIGTTNAKMKGNKTAYRKIDFDIPVNAARFGKEAGFEQFLLVSAIGASAKSNVFYTRLKGEVEDVIATFHYKAYHIFRPSLLLGPRKEMRVGERIAKIFMQAFTFLTPANYKPIQACDVAQAMVSATEKPLKNEISIYTFSEMKALSAKLNT
jgi:uncharacterized protein YbjT (DUF2867 family)